MTAARPALAVHVELPPEAVDNGEVAALIEWCHTRGYPPPHVTPARDWSDHSACRACDDPHDDQAWDACERDCPLGEPPASASEAQP